MVTLKVLGSGCPNCTQVAQKARQAVASMRVEATVEKVTDPAEIQEYHILVTPGLVVNEKLVSAGRIPIESEIMTWIADALEAL